jgi:hypothetical protein
MNKAGRAVVGIICAIVIIIGIAFAISYHMWIARGDQVQFSATGGFGLGNEPLMSQNAGGKSVQYGTNHNFLFVRDIDIDRKSFGSFTGGMLGPNATSKH